MRGFVRLAAVTLALGAVGPVACSPPRSGPGLDDDRVLGHVRHLVDTIGARPSGTEASLAAAAYIEGALAEAGADPERWPVGAVEVPEIAVGPMVFVHRRVATSSDDNIAARFGPDAAGALLLLAHYDSVAGSPGAIDNAVSVGLLLELARELAAHPPPFPVWLAFTAAEEDGLLGARKLAHDVGDRVAFAIALDLIGTDGPLVVNGAGELIRGAELRWLAAAATAAGVDLSAPWPARIVSRWWPQIERADHGAFTARGIRAVHLMTRGDDGEAIYLAYHTGRDRLDRVSRAAVASAGRVVLALAARPPPPPSSGDPGVWMPVHGNVVVPRWTFVTAAVALLLAAVLGLLSSRRPLEPGPGLLAAAAVWIVAVAVALALERITRGGYPAPWAHAPLRHVIGSGLVLVGAVALGALAVSRWRPWAGSDRYAVAAAVWSLVAGVVVWCIGALELAWIYLAPGALLAWAPRRFAIGVAAAVAAVVMFALLLAPGMIREIYFHGFLADGVPITAHLAIHGVTLALVAAHLLTQARPWGPGASFVIPVVAVAVVAAGALVLATFTPPCTADALARQRLSCELAR